MWALVTLCLKPKQKLYTSCYSSIYYFILHATKGRRLSKTESISQITTPLTNAKYVCINAYLPLFAQREHHLKEFGTSGGCRVRMYLFIYLWCYFCQWRLGFIWVIYDPSNKEGLYHTYLSKCNKFLLLYGI